MPLMCMFLYVRDSSLKYFPVLESHWLRGQLRKKAHVLCWTVAGERPIGSSSSRNISLALTQATHILPLNTRARETAYSSFSFQNCLYVCMPAWE